MTIGLEFLENSGGEAEGLSDAGIETFRESPFAAVARETGQNSRDARDKTDEPVVLKFDVISIPAGEFPPIDDYRTVVRLCYEKSKRAGREKEIGFFKNAVEILNNNELKVLRIADFNTKGVRGPCEEGKPFHTLAKTDGMSVKEEIGSGGSFGIGKNAAFALSDIQTVFLSTRYREDGSDSDSVLCMGKTLLISHTDTNGIDRRRKGYWGQVKDYMPLDDLSLIPEWLRRTEQGTSIFSICPRSDKTNWQYRITAAILINFFCAIERREMEFEIDGGSILINKNTIQSLFNDVDVKSAVNELDMSHRFDAAKRLHECLIDKNTSTHEINIPDLGDIYIHTLLRDGMNYTVGIIRNGMYITDNFRNFNHPFERFPLHKEFVAIIEPKNSKESEWFKRLENPSHNSLSAEQITDPEMRELGRRLFGQLARKIRSYLRSIAVSPPTESIDLDELNEFFVTDGAKTEDEAGTETDPRAKQLTIMKRTRSYDPLRGGKGYGTPDDPPLPGQRSTTGRGSTPGQSHRRRKKIPPVNLVSERALIPDNKHPKKRHLIFTSPVSSEISIGIVASGLNSSEKLAVATTSIGRVKNGEIEITCNQDDRYTLDVEFENAYQGPVEFYAYLSDK